MPQLISNWAARTLSDLALPILSDSAGLRFLHLATAAREHATLLPAAEVYEHARTGTPVIDVREWSEFARSHIPSAINIPRGVLELRIEKLFPDADAPLILYCNSGNRSALAASNLAAMGYERIKVLERGLQGWIRSQFSVRSRRWSFDE